MDHFIKKQMNKIKMKNKQVRPQVYLHNYAEESD